MNRYSVLRFGSTFELTEIALRKHGYACEWSCHSDLIAGQFWPSDFDYNGNESGWELRRKIKKWCAEHDFIDYKIVRNTGYCKDIHGVVYEVWTHIKDNVRRLVKKWQMQGRIIDGQSFGVLKSIANGTGDIDREDWVIDVLDNSAYKKSENGDWVVNKLIG